jgi:hypothetical protein
MWDFNNNFILFFNTFTKWKLYELETCIDLYYLMFNFINWNEDGEIRTRDHLIIKILI